MPIALPVPETTWTILPCVQVLYTSLAQVCAESIFTIVKRLKAQGYTVKGSCDGVTGAMDGVDRWDVFAKAQVRFNGAAGAQSWFVLTDGDGADIVFSFNSATDDQYNFWVSYTGVAIAAGTPAQEPTATDQSRINAFYTAVSPNNPTIVNEATSLPRRVSVWVRTDRKGFRVAIARNNVWVSKFGKDRHLAATYGAGVTVHPGHGFYMAGNGVDTGNSGRIIMSSAATAANTRVQQFLITVRRTDTGSNLSCAKYTRITGGVGDPVWQWDTSVGQPSLQGGVSYQLRRYGIYAVAGGSDGDVGRFIDWYLGRHVVTAGDTYGTLEWITIDPNFGIIWPWDGVTVPVMS